MPRLPTRPLQGAYTRAEIQRAYRQRQKANLDRLKAENAALAALVHGAVPAPQRVIQYNNHNQPPVAPAVAPAQVEPAILQPPPAAAQVAYTDLSANWHNPPVQPSAPAQPIPPVHLAAGPVNTGSSAARAQDFRDFTRSGQHRNLIVPILVVAQGKHLTDREIAAAVVADKWPVLNCLLFLRDQGLCRFGDNDRVIVIPDALAEYEHRLGQP